MQSNFRYFDQKWYFHEPEHVYRLLTINTGQSNTKVCLKMKCLAVEELLIPPNHKTQARLSKKWIMRVLGTTERNREYKQANSTKA